MHSHMLGKSYRENVKDLVENTSLKILIKHMIPIKSPMVSTIVIKS